jgi:TPR repeat protein
MQAIPFTEPNFEGLTKTQIDLLTPLLYKSSIERAPLSFFAQFIDALKDNSEIPRELQAKLDEYLHGSSEKLIAKRLGIQSESSKPKKKLVGIALASTISILSLAVVWTSNSGNGEEKNPKLPSTSKTQAGEVSNSANQPTTPPPTGLTSNDCEQLFLANSKDALAACKVAAAKNDDRSTYYLAAIYDQNGQKKEAETNYLKAVKLYKDDTKSMVGLVQIYLDRKDTKNYEKWVETCANYQIKTTSGARCKLLFGIDQISAGQTKMGIAYLSDSFDWGNTSAGTYLAKYYETKKDNTKALTWYEKAAAEGDPLAQSGLIALSYDLGKFDIWKKWITKSANEGNVTDIGKLALYLTIGDKNYVEGKKWGLIGAKAGDAVSMFAAGYSYYKGDKNVVEAKTWLLKSAKLDNLLSARVLGEIYRGEKNPNEAIIWYKKASIGEDLSSTYQLAMIYLNDLNSPAEACVYFQSTLTLAEKLKKSGDFVASSDQKLVENSTTGIATFCS